MLEFFLISLAGLGVLSVSELVRRRLGIANEASRKTYHIVHGLLIGVAPFFVSYNIINMLELLVLGEMVLVRFFKLLPWLYKVCRGSITSADFPGETFLR
jgi:hypothetical protein